MKNSDRKDILSVLYSKYETMILSKKQCAEVLGVSTQKLDLDRSVGAGVPYQQNGTSGNVKYPLNEVVTYMLSNIIKTSEL